MKKMAPRGRGGHLTMTRGKFSQLLAPGLYNHIYQAMSSGGYKFGFSGWVGSYGNIPSEEEEKRDALLAKIIRPSNPLNLAKECARATLSGLCGKPAEWQIEFIINGIGNQKFFCNTCLKHGLGWNERYSNIKPIAANAPIEEVEYIELTRGWLGDTGVDFVLKLFEFIRFSGGAIQYLADSNSYLIVDDNMTDESITELAERLEGHPIQSKKIKIIKKKEEKGK